MDDKWKVKVLLADQRKPADKLWLKTVGNKKQDGCYGL